MSHRSLNASRLGPRNLYRLDGRRDGLGFVSRRLHNHLGDGDVVLRREFLGNGFGCELFNLSSVHHLHHLLSSRIHLTARHHFLACSAWSSVLDKLAHSVVATILGLELVRAGRSDLGLFGLLNRIINGS